jgi:hypothetical protein
VDPRGPSAAIARRTRWWNHLTSSLNLPTLATTRRPSLPAHCRRHRWPLLLIGSVAVPVLTISRRDQRRACAQIPVIAHATMVGVNWRRARVPARHRCLRNARRYAANVGEPACREAGGIHTKFPAANSEC